MPTTAITCPTVRIESHRLKTNTQSATAYRGFGGPQGMVGIERVMDHIALALGRDPLEVRRANFYAAMADAGGARPRPPCDGSGPRYCRKDEIGPGKPRPITCRSRISSATNWWPSWRIIAITRRAGPRLRAWNAASPILKRGIALTPVKFGISFTLTYLNQAGALVHVYQDGSIHLNHGGTEMGQGLNQKVAQVAAAVFGVDTGRVKITATDTAKVPNTSATAASSGSDLNGMAAQAACETIRDRHGRVHRRKSIRLTPATVRFADGAVRVAGAEYGFAQVAALGLSGAGVAVLDRVLCHAEDRLGPGARAQGGRSFISPMAPR